MPANTEALDDGKFVTTSSVSVVASRATVRTQDLTATGVAAITGALTLSSTLSVGGAITAQGTVTANGAIQANSVVTAAGWLYGGVFISSATTAQSGATSKISQQGQLYFSVQSLTSNGGEFGFRSGNTVYRFASVAVG